MAEHLNNNPALLGTGSRRWSWGAPEISDRALSTPGARGAYSYLVAAGSTPGRIDGLLIASGADADAANAAMNTMETAIRTLCLTGAEIPWEDDCGHAGSHLVLLHYVPSGQRAYSGNDQDGRQVWQRYAIDMRENWGLDQ